MSTLFITIGTRDIRIDKNELLSRFPKEDVEDIYEQKKSGGRNFLPRKGGAFLLENWDVIAEFLEMPIVSPVITRVLEELKGAPKQTYLIATNQSETEANENFRANDSIYFAELVKSLLEKKYKQFADKKIEILQVQKDVAYLDLQYKFWQKIFNQAQFNYLKELNQFYLSNQGGIVAVNTGLLMAMLDRFGEKIRLINVNEATKRATPLVFANHYIKEKHKQQALEHIKNYEYNSLKDLDLPEDASLLSEYASHRLNFDFEGGMKWLDQIQGERAFRDQLISESKDLIREVENKKVERLLAEMVINAKIKFQQGAYVDFLLRFFRIFEELTKVHVLYVLPGLVFEKDRWAENFSDYLLNPAYEDLKRHLDAAKIGRNRSKLKYLSPNPSIPLLSRILAFYKADPRVETFFSFNRKADGLRTLRNNSIGAHAFSPVSVKLIEEKLSNSGINISEVFKYLEKAAKVNKHPFDKINLEISRIVNSF